MVSPSAFSKFFDYFKTVPAFFGRFLDFKSNLNLNSGTLFVGLGLVAVLLYGLSLGRTRAIISLLSIYIAFTFDKVFPYFNELRQALKFSLDDYVLRLSLFLAVYAAVFVIFNYSFIKKKFSSSDFSLFSVLMLSVLQLGLLASILASFLPRETLKFLGPFYNFLAGDKALFYWSIVPVPAILFLGR